VNSTTLGRKPANACTNGSAGGVFADDAHAVRTIKDIAAKAALVVRRPERDVGAPTPDLRMYSLRIKTFEDATPQSVDTFPCRRTNRDADRWNVIG
jgi:hypothetical protein